MRPLTIALLVVLLPCTARAAGWVQQPRHCYGKLWDRSWFGSKAYTAEGLRVGADVPSYQDHLVNLYAECGIHPWVTAIVALAPAGYAKSDGRGTFYMGPLSGGVRVGLLREGPLRLAASARYGFAPAVGDEVLSDTAFTTDDGKSGRAVYLPAVENHFGELLAELGWGFALGTVPSFLSATLGARLNGAEGIDHALVSQLQWGVTLWQRLVLDLHFMLYEPFFQEVVVTNTAGVGQTRYLGFGFTASYWIVEALAVFANLEGVFYAESNAQTPSFSFGLETRFSL
jgi:hypothetical protein